MLACNSDDFQRVETIAIHGTTCIMGSPQSKTIGNGTTLQSKWWKKQFAIHP